MPVDYSRFDNIELSDDEDIEVHPNIDKASWIRFKQKELHEERAKRKARIAQIDAELALTAALKPRLNDLVHADPPLTPISLETAIALAHHLATDPEAPRQEGNVPYDAMIATLLTQIHAEISALPPDSIPEDAITSRIAAAMAAMEERSAEQLKEKASLEKEANAKLTSDNMFTEGKSRTLINKPAPEEDIPKADPSPSTTSSSSKKKSTKTTTENTFELINTPTDSDPIDEAKDSLPLKFSRLTRLEQSWSMLKAHPELYADDKAWEEVMAEAFEAGTAGNNPRMENCIRQGKILEYIKELGRDRIDKFFERMLGSADMARKAYFEDVSRTIAHVKTRCKVIRSERTAEELKRAQLAEEDQDAPLEMQIPEDATEDDRKRAAAFDTFPPRFQRALLSGELEAVNSALENIEAKEQQRILDLCNAVGFLDIERTVDEEDPENPENASKEDVSKDESSLIDSLD